MCVCVVGGEKKKKSTGSQEGQTLKTSRATTTKPLFFSSSAGLLKLISSFFFFFFFFLLFLASVAWPQTWYGGEGEDPYQEPKQRKRRRAQDPKKDKPQEQLQPNPEEEKPAATPADLNHVLNNILGATITDLQREKMWDEATTEEDSKACITHFEQLLNTSHPSCILPTTLCAVCSCNSSNKHTHTHDSHQRFAWPTPPRRLPSQNTPRTTCGTHHVFLRIQNILRAAPCNP